MNDFLHFVEAIAQVPRLAIALLAEALHPIITACGVIAGYMVFRRILLTRKDWKRELDELTPEPATSENKLITNYKTMDEDAFIAWWQAGMEAMDDAFFAIPEKQARWLYAAYLNNIEIIKAQVASEVVD